NPKPESLNPKPETRNPELWTRNPEPQTITPKPYTLHPKSYTLHPMPQSLNPKLQLLKPERYTVNRWRGWQRGARHSAGAALSCARSDRFIIHCQTTSVSATHATHCATTEPRVSRSHEHFPDGFSNSTSHCARSPITSQDPG
ncbi:hypothetical protein T484DRAFT_1639269, partial [Baffinella frigidus]